MDRAHYSCHEPHAMEVFGQMCCILSRSLVTARNFQPSSPPGRTSRQSKRHALTTTRRCCCFKKKSVERESSFVALSRAPFGWLLRRSAISEPREEISPALWHSRARYLRNPLNHCDVLIWRMTPIMSTRCQYSLRIAVLEKRLDSSWCLAVHYLTDPVLLLFAFRGSVERLVSKDLQPFGL